MGISHRGWRVQCDQCQTVTWPPHMGKLKATADLLRARGWEFYWEGDELHKYSTAKAKCPGCAKDE